MRLSLSCFAVKVQALQCVNFVKQMMQTAFSWFESGEIRYECGVSVFIFGLFVLECGGCRGRKGIRRRGRGGTFLFFGCWLGQNSVGLGLGG